MAYRFNTSGDRIEFAITPLSGYTIGPVTYAALFKRITAATSANFFACYDSTLVTPHVSWIFNASDFFRFNISGIGGTNGSQVESSTTLWYLTVVTWAGGAGVAPRFHVHDGTSWVHAAGSTLAGNAPAVIGSDRLLLGDPGAPTCKADIVCTGLKKSDTADLAVEALTPTAFQSWKTFNFDWLIGFDSAGVRTDQGVAGTGGEIARTGTSLVADPPGWSWVTGGGGGGGGASARNQYANQQGNGIDMRTMQRASHASLANGVSVVGAAEGTLTTTGSPSGVLGTGANADLYTPVSEAV